MKEVKAWHSEALCGTVDPELFFLMDRESIRRAKSICKSCPVRNECLADAVEAEMVEGQRFGVYGGFDADERKRFAARYVRG